ncbi:gamma-tubulin complex component 2 isoform X2 [Aethina tumida]|uniref:gamma-tubulin complex component 2 isoform X2 n=1 Tax=Aethina tumida TaxID=116153 RepID=UPI0021473E12|nr:gamma-tubulin complex component 2 isoform X2 [Aethina tumida]
MSEFKLHSMVAELLKSLDDTVNISPEKIVESLQKSITNNPEGSTGTHVTIQSNVQYIASKIENSQGFLAKFEDLQEKNVDSLNPYVQLLNEILKSPNLIQFLQKNKNTSQTAVSNTESSVTKADLPQIKTKLKKAITTDMRKSVNNTANMSMLSFPSTPSIVSWSQRRPSISWDFSSKVTNTLNPAVPEISQENLLIEVLLNILIGIPGGYIEPDTLKDINGPRLFKIDENVGLTFKDCLIQILPLASHVSVIQRFCEEKVKFEFGQVNNALASSMWSLIKDHLLFTIQLESEFKQGTLSLQKIWFFVQRNMMSLETVAHIASTISKSDAKGGKVLTFLHDYITQSITCENTKTLCIQLMEAACVPYMSMLSMWIFKGIISDPIKEFLVEDMEVLHKEDLPVDYSADYWDKKYSVRRERIPKFLEPVADIILKSGKYLNVIRQCGKPIKNKLLPITYKMEEKQYIQVIQNAYTFASQTLLDLVIKEKDLIGRLRSVKHYLLLDQGDFIVTFLTMCDKELTKDVGDIVQGRLESLMDLALRISSAVNDPYKDDLRVELLPNDLQSQMLKILSIQTSEEQKIRLSDRKKLSGLESFSFSYEVLWPLSLVLNRKSLTCYQMIFRHLFYCKYVERRICQIWHSNKVAKKFHYEHAQQYRAAFALRQRMLHCVQNLEYHMMVEVIEPHWKTFLHKVSKVNNVDELLTCHCDFLDSCLRDCMLTIQDILQTITNILSIAMDFCGFMQQEFNIHGDLKAEEAVSFKDKINQYDEQFTDTVLCLLNQINNLNRDACDHERLFNLLYRLDNNSYYTNKRRTFTSHASG